MSVGCTGVGVDTANTKEKFGETLTTKLWNKDYCINRLYK